MKKQYANCEPKSFAYIDNLYDYKIFLDHVEHENKIGCFPSNKIANIAIIGAGLSGLISAYELLRAGATQVTLFESETNRCGGRFLTQKFHPKLHSYIAEMGAMRFPLSEFAFFHYLNKFNIDTTTAFPDPGCVDTEIHYQGTAYLWRKQTSPPDMFQKVDYGWKMFLSNGAKISKDKQLIAPLAIKNALIDGRLEDAQLAWQQYLDVFGDTCFYSALVQIFTGEYPPGGEAWEKPQDFSLFGALGIGSGGFHPVFRASFIEIMRLIVNGLEDDQRLIPAGVSTLTDSFSEQIFKQKTIEQRVIYEKVIGITRTGHHQFKITTNQSEYLNFDRVIVTTSTRAMQLHLRMGHHNQLLQHHVETAINQTHLVGSSKLFILTQNKFWLKHQLPHTIVTDHLAKGVYCLDYEPSNQDGYGVVLISYTWEDDSHKLITLTNKVARLERLVEEIQRISPKFAAHLVPLNQDSNYILEHDWLTDKHALGAFKLNYPGDDIHSQSLFFQFQSALNADEDLGIYLAGCSCSFTGGWAEGAVQTALNAVCATIKSLGGTLIEDNPLDKMRTHYNY